MPEMRGLDSARIHEPWRIERREVALLDYPAPIVPFGEAIA
jgi:deoxyribodipyrimidine photolyase